jgi:hypothetical protein
MKVKDIKMYVNTCDATMEFLPIWSYFYDKYWKPAQDVVVLGYSKPDFELPNNYTYHSMSSTQQGGVNNWSTYLRQYFEWIDDEYILWGIDDHIIADDVDQDILTHAVKLMNEDKTIGRFGLHRGISQREHIVVDKTDNYDIIELTQCESPGAPFAFRIDCNFALWRKSYLLKYLQPNWTPWQFEVDGSKMARNDGWRILSTARKYGIMKVEGKRGFSPGKVNLLGVKLEDVLNLIDTKLVEKSSIVGEQDWI